MKPTPAQAEQAAELLGVDVFDLGIALRNAAEYRFQREVARVRDYESPNFGNSRRILWAAQACDTAWSMYREAVEEAEPAPPEVSP